MKTPFPALWFSPYGRTACSVFGVEVVTLNEATRQAEIVEGVGQTARRLTVSFDSLATTPARAAVKLAPYLSAIPGRAPLQKMAVTTPADSGKPT